MWIYILIGTAGIALAGVLYYLYKKFLNPHPRSPRDVTVYTIKQKYISDCEQKYYAILSELLQDKPYIIFPQIPLSQIVDKNSEYRGELNRVIDFGIFSTDYRPLLCIEINDKTHFRPERQLRDEKVSAILSAAGLPLLTFWPRDGISATAIKESLQPHLSI